MSTDLTVTTQASGGTPLDSAHQSISVDADAGTSRVMSSPVSSPAKISPRRRVSLKPPKDSKIRKTALSAIALRAQGLKWREVGDTLGRSEETILGYLRYSVKRGWINISCFNDPSDQIEHVLRSSVVKNLHSVLNETQESRDDPGQPSSRAFEASLEIAKGTGLLKTHQVVKTDVQASLGVVMAIKVEMPPQAEIEKSLIKIRPGTVSGTPSIDVPIDAEIIKPEGA